MKQAAVTPDEFREWMNACGLETYQEAADALSLSLPAIKKYGNGTSPISTTVAFAMTAIYHKLPPWKKHHKKTRAG